MLALSSFLVFLTTFLAAGLAVLIGWFALHARKRLILAPEEEFALTHAKVKAGTVAV